MSDGSDVVDKEDEERDEEMDEYEEKYNFRYEEPGGAQIISKIIVLTISLRQKFTRGLEEKGNSED